MNVKNNILALLQPIAPAGNNLEVTNKPRLDEENNFSEILEEATIKVKKTDKNSESQSSNRKKSQQTDEDGKTPQPLEEFEDQHKKQVNDKASKALNSPKGDASFSKNSLMPKETSFINTLEADGSMENSQDAILQKLQALGLNPEQIQTFLNTFEANEDNEVSNNFLATLDTQLNLLQKSSNNETLSNSQVENYNLLPSTDREKLAADFLRSTGIENKTAENLSQKMIQVQTRSTGIENKTVENLSQKMIQVQTTRTTSSDNLEVIKESSTSDNSSEALLGFLKDSGQRGGSKKEQIIKLEKNSALQKTDQSESLTAISVKAKNKSIENTDIATPRIQTQNTLAKIFDQVQFQAATTAKGDLSSVLAGFENSTDSGAFMDLTNGKTSSEFMIQNVAKVNENFSNAMNEAKMTPSSKGLPNGVTEKSLVEQVVQKFSIKGTDNQNEIKIKLDPPALGSVRMNINTSGDSVKTTIIAENLAVKQAIETNLHQLKDSFTSQGMKIESFEVIVGGEPGFKENRQNRSQESNSGNSNKTGFMQDKMEENLVETNPTRYDLSAGGVSIII